jgi:3-hydroxy-9,10-secoandrosta-1,3,5(10)-triene-9,17-dione monooxygenase
MTIMQAPQKVDLIEKATELVPVLRENAAWSEENRRLPEDVVESMSEAGMFRLRAPARFGGYETDLNTLVRALTELGRGDGSASWVASIFSISGWISGLFPDDAQEEIFATPDVRVSGILSPSATAKPVDGGYLVSGKWPFNTGVLHAHWNILAAVVMSEQGPQPIMVVVPADELTVIDDWHTVGLRGTGSVSTAAEDMFVPAHRAVPLGPLMQEQYPTEANAASPVFRSPMILTGCVTAVGPALGLAKAALENINDRLPGRHIHYTTYDDQLSAPLTHLQIAEATMKLDEAEFHAYRAADTVDGKAADGTPWSVVERARVRADTAYACRLAKESVDIVNSASGAASIYSHVPIQRIERDVQTINLHALMNPSVNQELFGRVLCGLEPNTVYI